MADAMCGPSNALQNLQKHTSVDRTLQQDRLTQRGSPASGFRSQNQNAGVLDPEFAAFEAGFSSPAAPDFQHHHALPTPQLQQRHNAIPQAAGPSWASDFQRLHVSSPPLAAPHFHPQAQSQQASLGGWHTEFMQHQKPTLSSPIQQTNHASPLMYSSRLGGGMMGNNGFQNYQHPSPMTAQQQTSLPVFDDAAFEAAFEQAKVEVDAQEQVAKTVLQDQEMGQDISSEEAIIKDSQAEHVDEQIRIGSDTIAYEKPSDMRDQIQDADDLAKTAGELLEKLDHDQSQKFKQSNFLELMRRIRDREIQVEDDEFREVSTQHGQ